DLPYAHHTMPRPRPNGQLRRSRVGRTVRRLPRRLPRRLVEAFSAANPRCQELDPILARLPACLWALGNEAFGAEDPPKSDARPISKATARVNTPVTLTKTPIAAEGEDLAHFTAARSP